jgi:hypothetical protein
VQIENALAGVQDTMYSLLAPRELSIVTSEYVESAVFYTDGSLIERSAGVCYPPNWSRWIRI